MTKTVRFQANQTTEEFLQRLEAKGWPAAEAMMAYQEWRQFAFPEIRHAPEPDSTAAQMWALRARVTEALEALEDPADWKRYTSHWPEIAAGTVALSALKSPTVKRSEDLDASKKEGMARLLLESGTPREEAIGRVCSMNFRGLDRWASIREVGVDWTDVWETVGREVMAFPARSGENVNEETAESLLEDAFVGSGLLSLSWPAANTSDRNLIALLGQQVSQVNLELSTQTGWTGGVLGQNRRVSLLLGRGTDGCSGYCSGVADGSVITTRADIGWGPVAHEWLHALDNSVGQALGAENAIALIQTKAATKTQGKNVVQATIPAWKGLLDALNQREIEPALRAELARQAVEGLWDRHGSSVETREAIQSEFSAMASSGWTRPEALIRLLAHVRKPEDSTIRETLKPLNSKDISKSQKSRLPTPLRPCSPPDL